MTRTAHVIVRFRAFAKFQRRLLSASNEKQPLTNQTASLPLEKSRDALILRCRRDGVDWLRHRLAKRLEGSRFNTGLPSVEQIREHRLAEC